MSSTPKLNLDIKQGATFRHKLSWQDGNKRAIDLTGFSAKLQARSELSATSILQFELNTANGGIVLGGKSGTIALYISGINTTQFTWTKGVFDLDLTSASGEVYRLVTGSVSNALKVSR